MLLNNNTWLLPIRWGLDVLIIDYVMLCKFWCLYQKCKIHKLNFFPAIPLGPNLAPYYAVEMAEYPTGDYVEVKNGANYVSFIKIDLTFIISHTRLSLSLWHCTFDNENQRTIWMYRHNSFFIYFHIVKLKPILTLKI